MNKYEISSLRPYQLEAQQAIVQAWDGGVQSVMLQMPTGAGKTRLFVDLIQSLSTRRGDSGNEPALPHFLIVTHREELVEQISRTLTEHYHISHGILQGKNTRDTYNNIIVASVQTLSAMMRQQGTPCPLWEGIGGEAYIIIDEAHHSLAQTYKQLWKAYPQARKLGVTATPYRLRKATFAGLFDKLVESWPMRRLIEEGYLSDYRLLTISAYSTPLRMLNKLTRFGADGDYRRKDLQEAMACDGYTAFLYECYKEHASGKKGIVYAVSRQHAEAIVQRFREEGVLTAYIDFKTRGKERRRLLDGFRNGDIRVLVNVELFTEGFDCPGIEFVLLARPTRSLALYMQQVGRALRPTPGGGTVTILDCAGLRHRFGLPDRQRDWQSHYRGERPDAEQYERRTLGEPDMYHGLREVTRNAMKYRPKPAMEIRPSESGVHIFLDNDYAVYGLCDAEGNVIESAVYEEIHRTPYGWYQGSYRESGRKYPVVFGKDGRLRLRCSSLRQIEYNMYEASSRNRAIRFNLRLEIVPSETLTVNGRKVYQISHSKQKLYATSLELGCRTAERLEAVKY